MASRIAVHGDQDHEDLCCCEYINEDGLRSHLLQLLCDCEDIDQTIDSFFRSTSHSGPDEHRIRRICQVVHDRCRFPWIHGARRLPLDVVLPWLMAPTLLWLSSVHPILLVFCALMAQPLGLWCVHRLCLREYNAQTKFFCCWSLATTCMLILVYQQEVVGWSNMSPMIRSSADLSLVISLALAFVSLFCVKSRAKRHRRSSALQTSIAIRFCRSCNCFIWRKDHHCVWINECVSESNLTAFKAFLACSIYACFNAGFIFLTSTTCLSLINPDECAYSGNAQLTFAAGLYCVGIALLLVCILARQIRCSYERHYERMPD